MRTSLSEGMLRELELVNEDGYSEMSRESTELDLVLRKRESVLLIRG